MRLTSDDSGFSGDSKPVFVNDHLTPRNKRLLAEAVKRKKEKKWQFVWTDQGQAKAQKTADNPIVRVTCDDGLASIN